MRNFKQSFFNLLKKSGIGVLSAMLLPVIVLAVTTIGSNVTTDGHFLPGSNNASDLGAFGTAFRDLYASGTTRNQVLFNAGNLNASGTTYLSHTVAANNNAWDLGSGTSSWRNMYASGTIQLSTSIISSTNNTADLGAFGNAFGNMYASGTFRNEVLFNAGNLNASGTSRFAHTVPANNNAWDLGSGTSSWRNMYASGTIQLSTSIISSTNNTADLGAFGNAFGNMYASGTFRNEVLFNAGNLNASGTSRFAHTVPANNNAWDLGSGTSSWRNMYASGTIQLSTSIISSTNNTADLGAFGNAFGNMYASGTFRNQVLFNAGNLNASGTSYLSHTVPDGNNIWDLGSGTSSWRNINASGTLAIGSTGTSTFLGTVSLQKRAATTTLQLGDNKNTTANQGGCIALKDGANNGLFIYLSYDSRVSSGLATGTSPTACY